MAEPVYDIVDDEILSVLSKNLKTEWRDVGKHLSFSDSELNELENKKKHEMLPRWKQLKGDGATYNTLIDVLQRVKRPDLAILVEKDIEKRFQEAPSGRVLKEQKLQTTSETVFEKSIKNTSDVKKRFQEAHSGSVSKKQKLTTASETVVEDSVKNTSGSLKAFVKQLRETYHRMVKTSRPVPYLSGTVNNIFVDRKVEEQEENTKFWENRWKYVGNSRDAILKNDAERVLLIGEHGSGKSTLALALAYEWSMAEKGSPVSDIDIFLFISLHKVPKVKSIYKMIKLLLLPKDSDITDDTLKEILSSPHRRVVLILDDLHTFSGTSKDFDVNSIVKGNLFPAVKVVITTIPNHSHLNSLAEHAKRARMIGFDESLKHIYIQKAFSRSKSENEKYKNLLKAFKENYLLNGLGHLPLYFAMFVYQLVEKPELADRNSITDYFESMRKRLFSSNKALMGESASATENSSFRLKLEEIAFDGLTSNGENLYWNKFELVIKLGLDGYELYKSVGILLQEEIFHDDGNDAQGLDKNNASELRVRFFDKSMQEFYAAHHLVRLIKETDPKETSQYSEHLLKLNTHNAGLCYVFACGLDNSVAKILMNYPSFKRREDVTLALMEIGDTDEGKEFLSSRLEDGIHINTSSDGKHHQRAKAFFLKVAPKLKVQIQSVILTNLFGSRNDETGNLESEDGFYLPPLNGAKTLRLNDEGRIWTEDEFKRVLEYASACNGLFRLEFENCMLPFDVSEEADVLQASNKEFCVQWISCNHSYFLTLNPFRWWYHPFCNEGGMSEDFYLSKGGPPLNHSLLNQIEFEQDEGTFYQSKRKSEWQRTHVSSEPTTRNRVSDTALEKTSSKFVGDWTAIASRLQVSEFYISSIKRDATVDTPQKGMLVTLKKWKCESWTNSSPQALERALRHAAQDDVADALNEAILEESTALVAKTTTSEDEGVIQLVGTGVKLHVPIEAFQFSNGVTINILPYHSLGDTTEHFEDNSTVAVQLLPNKLKLSCAAKLTLPHCLKLKNVVNSDVKIFRSFHETGAKPVWKDVTPSVTFQLLENCCEIYLQELCSIKYSICSTNVEAKRLTFYAFGNKCNEDAKNVSVDIGCHPDLPGEKTIYQRKLRENFLGDSQSFFFYKNEGPINPRISLVQVLPVWEQRPVTSVSLNIFRPAKVPLSEKSCTFTFKRPRSSAILPRCVFEVCENPHRPKYRLNVNFRVFQQLVTHTTVLADDALFFLSHYLNDNWLNIGRRLQVHENHLQEIRNKDISLQLKAYLMMIKWKHNERERAFAETLSTALNEEKVELTSELQTLLMGYAARDNAASIDEKDDRVLPKESFLMNSSDVSADGGLMAIDGTGVELKLRRRSFRNPNEEKKIGIRLLPDRVFKEPAKCFEAYSTTTVELFPNSLQLEEPASVYLPHCLKLKNAKDCEVRIFQSYHNKDDYHLWEDITSKVNYKLSDCSCKIDIKRFGLIKYTIRGTQVEGKKLAVYALGENCNQDDSHVNVRIGYHLDLPGHDRIIKGKFNAVSTKFLCSKKEREDVEVKCVKTEPEWELDSPDVERKLPFLNIESSLEGKGCKFQFERDRRSSNLPRCDFEIFQGNQSERSRMSITFTPPNLPYFDEDEEVTWQLPSEQLQSDGSSETEQEGVPDELLLESHRSNKLKTDEGKTAQRQKKMELDSNNLTLRYVSKRLGKEWRAVCGSLNITDAEMDQQKENNPSNTQEVIYQCLLLWKRRAASNATFGDLSDALKSQGLGDLAEKVLRHADLFEED